MTHIDDGFDFLGQNVRRYGTKVLLKPSRKNVRTFLAGIDQEIQQRGPGAHSIADIPTGEKGDT